MKKLLLILIASNLFLGACETKENFESTAKQSNEMKELVIEDESEDFKLIVKSDKNIFVKGKNINILAELYPKDETGVEILHHGSKPINLRVENTDVGLATEDVNKITKITKEEPFSYTYNKGFFEDLPAGIHNVIISSYFEFEGEQVHLENNLEITIKE